VNLENCFVEPAGVAAGVIVNVKSRWLDYTAAVGGGCPELPLLPATAAISPSGARHASSATPSINAARWKLPPRAAFAKNQNGRTSSQNTSNISGRSQPATQTIVSRAVGSTMALTLVATVPNSRRSVVDGHVRSAASSFHGQAGDAKSQVPLKRLPAWLAG